MYYCIFCGKSSEVELKHIRNGDGTCAGRICDECHQAAPFSSQEPCPAQIKLDPVLCPGIGAQTALPLVEELA
ncbi:MAG: hypothetical protein V1846_05255, partial [Candidatus Komeilibacteria bacterium]